MIVIVERTCLWEEAQTAVEAEEAHKEAIIIVFPQWECFFGEYNCQMGFLMVQRIG